MSRYFPKPATEVTPGDVLVTTSGECEILASRRVTTPASKSPDGERSVEFPASDVVGLTAARPGGGHPVEIALPAGNTVLVRESK